MNVQIEKRAEDRLGGWNPAPELCIKFL